MCRACYTWGMDKCDHLEHCEYCKRVSGKGYQERYTARKKELYLAYKDKPCVDCGNQCPSGVMDLHHRDPSTKEFNPSQYMTVGYDRLKQELDKCDVLCSNCHRVRTYH